MTTKTNKSTIKSDLLLKVEHIKYRTAGAGRSPVGILYIYSDHVEWKGPDGPSGTDDLNLPFSSVKVLRVSAPEKPKIQLQICMYDENQATFVFMEPQSSSSTLLEDRNLVRDTLQDALVHHRKKTQKEAPSTNKSQQSELERKEKILRENPYLKNLYMHLVTSKLITPQDFWSQHYKSDDSGGGDVGVSGGFLSNLVQSDGTNGIRLNLTTDTIQSIFRTYPAVEKKHLALVPHEMTEQQFWTKFFESHYFHRERAVELNPNDPFSDCVKMDEKDMSAILQSSHVKKNLDFGYLREDLGLINEIRSNNIPIKESELKTLLVKRCNYHSERVLSTVREAPHPFETNGIINHNDDLPGPSYMNGGIEMELESEELRNLKDTNVEDVFILNMNEWNSSASKKISSNNVNKKFASLIIDLANDEPQV